MKNSSEPAPRVSWTPLVCHAARVVVGALLKGLLDLTFWAIVVLVPLYVALVVVGYLRSGDPDMALGVDVWFNQTPVAWVLEGDGGRAARIVHGLGAVRFQRLPWPDLAVLLAASMLRLLLWLPVLQQLRKLLEALSVGRPFVRENADRLRKLGWAGPPCWSPRRRSGVAPSSRRTRR